MTLRFNFKFWVTVRLQRDPFMLHQTCRFLPHTPKLWNYQLVTFFVSYHHEKSHSSILWDVIDHMLSTSRASETCCWKRLFNEHEVINLLYDKKKFSIIQPKLWNRGWKTAENYQLPAVIKEMSWRWMDSKLFSKSCTCRTNRGLQWPHSDQRKAFSVLQY